MIVPGATRAGGGHGGCGLPEVVERNADRCCQRNSPRSTRRSGHGSRRRRRSPRRRHRRQSSSRSVAAAAARRRRSPPRRSRPSRRGSQRRRSARTASRPSIKKWGSANALRRYRCKACKVTFNALTGTPLAQLHKRELWGRHAQRPARRHLSAQGRSPSRCRSDHLVPLAASLSAGDKSHATEDLWKARLKRTRPISSIPKRARTSSTARPASGAARPVSAACRTSRFPC